MRKLIMFLGYLSIAILAEAQSSGSITVQGDFNNYYPVTWYDGGWGINVATELTIGRSDVHTNSSWRGSIIAKIRYHVTDWGHGSNFIDADIRQGYSGGTPLNTFIAGWMDPTNANGDNVIVIWLRGGGTTYYYNANYAVNPVIYDGVQNPLPYQITNRGTLTYKTAPDSYVVSAGLSYGGSALFNGNVNIGSSGTRGTILVDGSSSNVPAVTLQNSQSGTNQWTLYGGMSGVKDLDFFNQGLQSYALTINGTNNYVGIGTTSPQSLLSVNGAITAQQVTVTKTGWPDFVFHPSYKLRPLSAVENYIHENNHLPDIPSTKEIEAKGLDLADMEKKQMQKIEELTLYVIEQDKRISRLENEIKKIKGMEKHKNLHNNR